MKKKEKSLCISHLNKWRTLPWDLSNGPPLLCECQRQSRNSIVHTHQQLTKISLPQSHRSNHDGSLTDSESPQSWSSAETWWQTYQTILWSSRWGREGWHDNWSGRNLDDGQTENNSIWSQLQLLSLFHGLHFRQSRFFSKNVNYAFSWQRAWLKKL